MGYKFPKSIIFFDDFYRGILDWYSDLNEFKPLEYKGKQYWITYNKGGGDILISFPISEEKDLNLTKLKKKFPDIFKQKNLAYIELTELVEDGEFSDKTRKIFFEMLGFISDENTLGVDESYVSVKRWRKKDLTQILLSDKIYFPIGDRFVPTSRGLSATIKPS